MFALIDCNNFYASCQRVFRPDLIGKPIVVLSNNDGCVIARSNEAKNLGIPMGAPAYQYNKLFKEKNVEVFSANFALYGDMSQRVMDLLSEYAPEIEVYSIDEAFLKLEGFDYFDLEKYASQMQLRVTKCTGIPISVGIARTKALAKVANRIAKKFPDRTKNVYVIDTDEKRIKALKWLKIEDVWGIGRKHSKRLKALGINTAYDFTQLSDGWVKANLAIVGLRLKQDLQGNPTLDLEEIESQKNISTTRSFQENYTKLSQLEERITTFAVSCAEKLRKQKSCCNTIMVFINTNRFRTELGQYNQNIIVKLPFPTNSSLEIAKFAVEALHRIFKEGYEYKKAGVVLMNFTDEDKLQVNLFDNTDARHKILMESMDKINAKHGQHKIKLASQDFSKMWKMKQENLSPCYTTKLSDIIQVHL
jgi:DNA polymerase V